MDHPRPRSRDKPLLDDRTEIRSPTPGLQSLQGAYSRNIMQLEKSAEELSQGGSDIGEEIRKMSRRSSLQSWNKGDDTITSRPMQIQTQAAASRSRNASTSSYANSIVDVNGNARWGGYSPAGWVTSPAGSVHSGSWSHASVHRQASGSSKLSHLVEPVQEGRPLDSPLASATGSYFPVAEHGPSRQPSQSSFAQRYDQIAGQIEEQLIDVPPSPPKHGEQREETHDAQNRPMTPPDRPRSADTFQQAQTAFHDFDGVHFSPSTEEFVHLDENGNEIRRVSARHSSGNSIEAASLLRTPRARPITYHEPPPDNSMVYYPAPVPRMLNLPKRLSQLPSASVQAKRRSQVLSQLPMEARQSAPWLPQLPQMDFEGTRSDAGSSLEEATQHRETLIHPRQSMPAVQQRQSIAALRQRQSMMSINNLPPQLRASVFFDHQSVPQDIEVQESVVATLDSILEASASAPVSAFTDHPFAGNVSKTVFAAERPLATRRSTTTLAMSTMDANEDPKLKKRRSGSMSGLLKRNSSGDELNKLDRRASKSSLTLLLDGNEGGRKLQKRRSQMSVGDELQEGDRPDLVEKVASANGQGKRPAARDMSGSVHPGFDGLPEGPEDEIQASGSRPMTPHTMLDEGQEAVEKDFQEQEQQEDVEEGEPMFAQPTTLLAELQLRKAQQKTRNRTAATAFPNGMHSTLLELDAVAQIEKKNRKKGRIALAWQDPRLRAEEEMRGDEDDEVPLGMLFPGKDGLVNKKTGGGSDWDRPLGLMEKREMEDNEPLSSRRNRMLGLPPPKPRDVSPDMRVFPMNASKSELHLAGQPDAPPEEGKEDEQEEGETLAQRLKRMKTKAELDKAIDDVAPKDGSRPVSTFADDVLSQFGGLNVKESEQKPDNDAAPAPEVLEDEETLGQRRARLQREREASGEQGPALKSRTSSNSLANLLATNPVGGSRKPSREHKPAEGTLLHASGKVQEQQRQQLLNTNKRSSSYGLTKPLIDPPAQQQNGFGAAGGFAGGLYNGGNGTLLSPAQPMQTAASTPMFGMGGANSYFAPATMPLGAGMMGYPMQSQPQMMNMSAYQALTGGAPMAMPGYPMGAAYPGMGAYGFPQQQTMAQGIGRMGLAAEEPLDGKQREMIDRWRMSVAQ